MKYSPSTHELFNSDFIESGVYVRVPDDLVTLSDIQIENLKNKPPGAAIYHDADMNLHYSSAPPSTKHSFNYSSLQWEIDPAKVEAARKAAIPTQVTMRQARLALLAAGKLIHVKTAIDALPEPQKSIAQTEWEYSSAVQRSSTLVEAIGQALGLDNVGIDNLFIEAAKL